TPPAFVLSQDQTLHQCLKEMAGPPSPTNPGKTDPRKIVYHCQRNFPTITRTNKPWPWTGVKKYGTDYSVRC
ncbi:hypothetical protein, partial [Parafrankia elaeagni]